MNPKDTTSKQNNNFILHFIFLPFREVFPASSKIFLIFSPNKNAHLDLGLKTLTYIYNELFCPLSITDSVSFTGTNQFYMHKFKGNLQVGHL